MGKQRIGFLLGSPRPSPGTSPNWDAIVEALRELGYTEGQNVVFEYAYTEGELDRRKHEAARLVATKPDIIVAAVGSDALALREATSTIPIVVAAGGDLVGMRIAGSLAKPGGNVTGLQMLSPELAGKRLELLRTASPRVRRVGVLHQKVSTGAPPRIMAEVEGAARTLGIQVVRSVAIDGADGFDGAFGRVREARLDGVFVVSNPFMTLHRRRLAELAARYRLPAIYEISLYVTAGGLMSYGPDAADLFRRAALYVDKIFKGAKPADLPIEQPSKFDLAINLKAARAIGLTIPQSLLFRATQVIDP